MATVYLAIQESLDRPVVLKILDASAADKAEDLISRFLAEGRIVASLNHPNIITIYDIGIANDSDLYISMEYVQGGDLKQRLELSISPEEALRYLSQITSALGEAHKHGIIHRDVKPANVLFKDDTPLLSDFGIAKAINADADLTSTGIFLGSPNYVSPEQADGIKLDGRADLYSLGCIFFEMLTGKKPFISDSIIDIVIQHKQAPIPRLPAELKDYQDLVDKLLAKKREERFPDAEALYAEITKLQAKLRSADRLRDYKLTGESLAAGASLKGKRSKQILIGLILLSLILFSTLKYVEIRIKDNSVPVQQITTNTVLSDTPAGTQPPGSETTAGTAAVPAQTPNPAATTPATQLPTPEVLKALLFLGRQSLDEYKLTYPPRDNAYYYFTRLLELDPDNQDAINGIMEIANRYSILAEQAMIKNEVDKTQAYVDLGLRIDPDNEALLAMKSFVSTQDTSLVSTIRRIFTGK
ncbi:MAG: Protein kinase protein [Gammaproteobacteria bacterium]|nr:Protein kinase protein [Gammaproteobacteria bacterium]